MAIHWAEFSIGVICGAALTVLLGRVVAWWVVRSDRPNARHSLLAPVAQIKRLRWLLARQAERHAETDLRYETLIAEFREAYEIRAGELDRLRNDVSDAVRKTRDLREELIDRAIEEARLKALAMADNDSRRSA